jgi:hypothetical protein
MPYQYYGRTIKLKLKVMKTLKQLHISVLFTMTFMLSVLLATAQGFRVESYQAAIHHIEAQSEGSLDSKTIMDYLHGNIPEVPPDMPEMVTEGFVITPLVAVVEYDSEVVEFSYTPERPTAEIISFEFTPEPDWLNTATPSISTDTFSFEVTSNNSLPDAKYTTFVATALVGGETNTFQAHIIQKPQSQPFINVSPENVIIEHIGGSQVFSVIIIDADGWDYSTTNGWINEVNGTKTESSIEFSFDQNNDLDARTGSITFTTTDPVNTASTTVTVFQHGKPAPFLTVDPLSLVAPPEGVSSEFHVITNVESWTYNVDDIDWITTVTPTATSFTLEIGTNNGSFRQATVEVISTASPTVKEDVYIRQYGVGQSYIIAEPTFITVPPSGATQTYTVNTNVTNWEVEIDTADDWIGVVTDTQTSDSVEIFIEGHTGDQPREGTIIFRKANDHSVADTVGVFQYTAAQPFLVASPKQKYSDPFGGDIEFLVFSNIEWDISSISDPGGMVTDTAVSDDMLTVTVGQNSEATARTAQITLAGGTLTETVSIYQAAPYILLNPREAVVACVTNTFEVGVLKYGITNIDIDSKPDWVNFEINTSSITLTIEANHLT